MSSFIDNIYFTKRFSIDAMWIWVEYPPVYVCISSFERIMFHKCRHKLLMNLLKVSTFLVLLNIQNFRRRKVATFLQRKEIFAKQRIRYPASGF